VWCIWWAPNRCANTLKINLSYYYHCWNSYFWSSGNPKNSLEVYISVTNAKSMHAYRPHRVSPLMELKLFHNWLLVSNSLWDSQLYCIILISCRIFLYEHEIGRMGYVYINLHITLINSSDCVEEIALAISIMVGFFFWLMLPMQQTLMLFMFSIQIK